MAQLYPIYLRLAGEKCLVVGGGKVAQRKVKSLLKSDACVTVVSPRLTSELHRLKEEHKITYHAEEFKEGHLEGMQLVISATDNEEVNRRVAELCFSKNILVNVADDPGKCSFFVPAVVRQGDLSIAVSTGGKSPLLAARIREQLERTYGPEYAEFLELLGQVRIDLIQNIDQPEKRREILEDIVQSDILSLIKEKRYEDIKERIQNAYRGRGR
ncbi:precorrin-2 dehydrogenase/sirohydrochlorin ferrochelatase family protein [Desulfofalx alkaliphila]|uniref:precorrin-2 dehydrogenase/sirohydrochlorin ferrochelatase family protein n=1 Tax=Desulfofalx alkaliphila TaxID=105483 RepID=UPI0004E12C78|nr:bifunctional precorrin-2 dehydrogenase/sirohydrochlorin ferrochelatase [Desulfofalx alkaliphila]